MNNGDPGPGPGMRGKVSQVRRNCVAGERKECCRWKGLVSQVRKKQLACDGRIHRRPKSVAGGEKNADLRRLGA